MSKLKPIVCMIVILLFLAGCTNNGGGEADVSELLPSVSTGGEAGAAEPGGSSAPQSTGGSSSSAAQDGDSSTAAAPITFRLTIPEGYTLARIGMTLEEMGVCTTDEFIAAAQNGDYSSSTLIAQQAADPNRCFDLEGYLFPDTYEFYSAATPEDIINTMLAHTETRLDSTILAEIGASGYTVEEILTIASIIQKEALTLDSMAMISSVLHNRLAIGQRLECDVTIKYVEGAIKPFITGDVDRYNEYYNTYKCPALPAGPICSPGMDAIKAALHPAESNYYFFVTDADNNYYYAETYEEHQVNVANAGL